MTCLIAYPPVTSVPGTVAVESSVLVGTVTSTSVDLAAVAGRVIPASVEMVVGS